MTYLFVPIDLEHVVGEGGTEDQVVLGGLGLERLALDHLQFRAVDVGIVGQAASEHRTRLRLSLAAEA